jgi:hypothetical protein
MQPSKLSISELFQQREQYLVPLFQRGYVWTLTDQIYPLWEDIADRMAALAEHRENARKVGGVDKLKPMRKHFLGAIIVGPADHGDTEKIAAREVIDGQQRITTLQIMLLAARDVFKSLNDEGIDEDLKLLTHNRGSYKQKSDQLKVLPTNVARDVMKTIATAGGIDEIYSAFPVAVGDKDGPERPGPVQAYLFFHAMLEGLLHCIPHDQAFAVPRLRQEQTLAQSVIRAIDKGAQFSLPTPAGQAPDAKQAKLFLEALQQCFQIMRLQLDAEDDPQIIFETLNARGVPLTPGDLIRNFIFLRASRSLHEVDSLYDDYWRSFDEKPDDPAKPKGPKFWRVESRQGRLKSTRLDAFFYFVGGLNKRSDLKLSHVFDEFKSWWDDEPSRDIKAELQRIGRHAEAFEKIIAPGHGTALERFSRRMQLLDTTTHIPLVLYLLQHKTADDPDFVKSITYLESYFLRRFVVGLTTQSYNRTFMKRILPNLADGKRADSDAVLTELSALTGDSQLWPDDARFKAAWQADQLYRGSNTRRVQAILEGLELRLSPNHHEYRTDPKKLSVEHVLPQKWKPSDYPLLDATDSVKATRARLIHSIGNLTLVTPGFNTTLSNREFKVKRPALARESALALNSYFQEFRDEDAWNDERIVERAERLFPYALAAWPRPQ